ncbi:HAD family hydrolase [Clostridium lundense]|uniref:HAD family hydrolase n=1 Tax=Clostridium lundense TaxID=319475 RepID=UPI00047F97CB|nr:HAD family hydrolase [Clostridium lundense]
MIFASDLDRTLIYSNFFLKPDITNTVLVESKAEKQISHMTEKSLKLLNIINKKILFIPTTTRTTEQFKRISIFNNSIPLKYAVVANGAIILKNGLVDLHWQNYILSQMKNLIPPIELIHKCRFFLDSEYVNSYRCCDNSFLYAVLKSYLITSEDFEKLILIANREGYLVTRNTKKVYMIPNFINKWSPIKYIMEIENEDKLIAAGDSYLDLPLLNNSTHGIIPSHGELKNRYKDNLKNHKNIYYTKEQGILSSDEFLENILQLIS